MAKKFVEVFGREQARYKVGINRPAMGDKGGGGGDSKGSRRREKSCTVPGFPSTAAKVVTFPRVDQELEHGTTSGSTHSWILCNGKEQHVEKTNEEKNEKEA